MASRRFLPVVALTPVLFAGVLLTYASLSPGSLRWMGYEQEDVIAGERLARAIGDCFRLRSPAAGIQVTRHGLLGVALKLPFAALGAWLRPASPRLADGAQALEPVVVTALLVALVFVWTKRTGAGPWRAWLAALGAGFATFLWPYAYMGMETEQSLGLLAAGYLALAPGARRDWPRTGLLALSGVAAVAAKATGFFLLPAVAFIDYRFFTGFKVEGPERRQRWLKTGACLAAVVAVRAANWLLVAHYYSNSGVVNEVRGLLIGDWFAFPANLLSLLFSANKGLIVYAPLALLGLLAVARWRELTPADRDLLGFALLALGGLAVGFALLRPFAEETWGPRYLHSALAPLAVALGSLQPPRAASRRRRFVLAGAAVVGFAVNLLGSAVHYGALHVAMVEARQHTLEAVQHDPVWNHVRFNSRVLAAWLWPPAAGQPPVSWTPSHQWWLGPVPAGTQWRAVNLSALAKPQPLLLRLGQEGDTTALRLLRATLLVALLVGLGLLGWSGRLAWSAAGRGMPRPVSH